MLVQHNGCFRHNYSGNKQLKLDKPTHDMSCLADAVFNHTRQFKGYTDY